MTQATYQLKLKRRRQQKTKYPHRLALLKSHCVRLVFRKSNQYIKLQLVEYKNGKDSTIIGVSSKELKKFQWMGKANIPSAYLSGYWIGKLGLQKGITQAVYDIGLHTAMHGGVVFGALKGALDAGLEIAHDAGVLPKIERIRGEHIQKYAEKLGNETQNRFSQYVKANATPTALVKQFEQAKNAMDQSVSGGKT